jgi:voltage-gated potassium channel
MELFRRIYSRLVFSASLLLICTGVGTYGYHKLENYPLLDALYMTIITITTVGYGETHPLSDNGRIFTIGLLLASFGTVGFAVSSLTSFIIQGEAKDLVAAYRLEKKLKRMTNHIIVCGYGRIGHEVCAELIRENQPFAVIEQQESALAGFRSTEHRLALCGDATQEELLVRAGIQRARALIATIPSDALNIFIVLTARSLNPSLTIVSRVAARVNVPKFLNAGCHHIIQPEKLGAMQMASLVSRPDLTEFLHQLTEAEGSPFGVQEFTVPESGTTLTVGQVEAQHLNGGRVIGLRLPDGSYTINPKPDHNLNPGQKVFVLGYLKA